MDFITERVKWDVLAWERENILDEPHGEREVDGVYLKITTWKLPFRVYVCPVFKIWGLHEHQYRLADDYIFVGVKNMGPSAHVSLTYGYTIKIKFSWCYFTKPIMWQYQ